MRFQKWFVGCLMLVTTTSAVIPSAFAATETGVPSYTLAVSNSSPSKGEKVEVVIKGHELKDLYAYELNVDFDPKLLTLKSAATSIPGFSVPYIVKDNHIQLAHTRVGKVDGDSGDQTLYTLTFEAIAQGPSEMTLSKVKLVDSHLVSTDQQVNVKADFQTDSSSPFDDLGDFSWALEAVNYLAEKGIVNGTGDRVFSPESAVSRADYVVLLMRALNLKGTAGAHFEDVEQGKYYEEAIHTARELGIVEGDDNNLFHPQSSVTREDMMVLTERALSKVTKQASPADEAALQPFNDVSDISDYALNSVSSLIKQGLVHGYGDGIHPKDTTNRAQAAVLIYNIVKSPDLLKK
jgi:hypothetical protein